MSQTDSRPLSRKKQNKVMRVLNGEAVEFRPGYLVVGFDSHARTYFPTSVFYTEEAAQKFLTLINRMKGNPDLSYEVRKVSVEWEK